jgi:large subunit ribosomal protein L11
MAKEIKAKVKINLPGGAATPAAKLGQVLGPHGVNMMEFCKQFNAVTANRKGETVPVEMTIFKDRTFEFIVKTPPTAELIRKKCNIEKGSSKPSIDKAGSISWSAIEEIAKVKAPDMNAHDLEQIKKSVAGTARSMGIDVVD